MVSHESITTLQMRRQAQTVNIFPGHLAPPGTDIAVSLSDLTATVSVTVCQGCSGTGLFLVLEGGWSDGMGGETLVLRPPSPLSVCETLLHCDNVDNAGDQWGAGDLLEGSFVAPQSWPWRLLRGILGWGTVRGMGVSRGSLDEVDFLGYTVGASPCTASDKSWG